MLEQAHSPKGGAVRHEALIKSRISSSGGIKCIQGLATISVRGKSYSIARQANMPHHQIYYGRACLPVCHNTTALWNRSNLEMVIDHYLVL